MSESTPDRAIALLSFTAFVSAASLRGTDPMLPLLADAFGTTPGGAAASITAFSVAYGLFQVVHGPIGDRIGKFRLVLVTSILSLVATVGCALAPTLGFLVAARFVAGGMVGAAIPLSIAWIGDVVPYEKRQAVLARFIVGQMLGVAIGNAAGGYVGEVFGWRSMFWLLAALYALAVVFLALELRRNRQAREDTAHAQSTLLGSFRRMGALLGRPWVVTVLLTATIEGGLFYGALSFVALHVHQHLGLGLGASGTVVTTFALGGLIYALVSGRVVRRLGERNLAMTGGFMMGGAFLGLLFAPSAGWVIPCLLAAGGGLYMLHNTLQVHATQMAPESRGAALALFALFLFTGQSLGVWLGARVLDAAGTTPLFLIAAIGLPLLGLDFRRRLGRRKA